MDYSRNDRVLIPSERPTFLKDVHNALVAGVCFKSHHMKNVKQLRKIEYEGDHKIDSLVIGNFGDVEFTARGNFELSGMIYSKKSVAFTIIGQGLIRFHGVCQKLTIHLVKGNCTLDFSELTCSEVCCVSLRDNSTTVIGPTKVISRANLQDEAVLKYRGTPRFQSYTLSGSSRIESFENQPSLAVG